MVRARNAAWRMVSHTRCGPLLMSGWQFCIGASVLGFRAELSDMLAELGHRVQIRLMAN